MEWEVLRRRLLMLFLGTLVAALLIMGSYRGWFGEYLQSIVLPIVEAARTLQRLHGAELDQWWKLIGGTISILSGCWFIYKSWSFAEHRMLFRIQQFLSRQDERLLHVRDGLIEVINGRRSVATTHMPLCTAKELGIALNDLKFGRVDQAHLALDKSIKSLKDQMAAWESQKGFLNRQLSASHLLRGVMLASPSGAGDASARRLRALEAEKHFDLAVSLHDNDPQALVYRAINAKFLGNVTRALEDYNRAVEILNGKPCDLLSRASFGAAQLWVDRNKQGKAIDLMEVVSRLCPRTWLTVRRLVKCTNFSVSFEKQ